MIDLYELAGADPSVRFSPYCWRVRMALAHKGVKARLLPWHFGDRKLPGGHRQVPVMVDDGRVIADSTAIAFHLEHKYSNGPSLFGGDGGEAHARFIIAWADGVLNPALLGVVAPDLIHLVRPDARPEFRAARERRLGMSFEQAFERRPAMIEAARHAMQPLRRVLKDADFLGGEEPSYADYAVFGSLQWVRCSSQAALFEATDVVALWQDRMLDLFGEFARGAVRAADHEVA